MQTDHAGITDDIVIEGNFPDDSHAEAELERLERVSMKSRDIVTDGHTSWPKICKLVHKTQKQLPFELHSLYRLWLLTRPVQPDEDVLTAHDLPRRLCEGRGPVVVLTGTTLCPTRLPRSHMLVDSVRMT